MASSVFARNSNFQQNRQFENPYQGNGNPFSPKPPVGEVMTFDNTMHKIVGLFVLLLITAGAGWFFPIVTLPAMIAGLVLGLVNAFKKEPVPGLIMAYAGIQGLFVGGISSILESFQPGIVSQAVLATMVVIGTTLALYSSGKVRATPKMTRFFMIAITAYFVFSLINLGLMLTGVTETAWGLHTEVEIFGIPLGLILGVFVVLLGAYSLILDFDFIQRGVENKIPERYGWTAAFGILVTVIWIYVEILRFISILRGE